MKLSMDGKGRAIDTIFIERLWRSVKYEHVYLFPASDGLECYRALRDYFEYYNTQRKHQSLGWILRFVLVLHQIWGNIE
ncbi:integrase core domain-containing protein [Sinomicrobium oceani]|uniref:integrase core domain-containing protein n=1 Tax=Sinomicrobium oceani TaxID=1150368 RepID=UPI00373FDACB